MDKYRDHIEKIEVAGNLVTGVNVENMHAGATINNYTTSKSSDKQTENKGNAKELKDDSVLMAMIIEGQSQEDIAAYFRVTERTIRNWLTNDADFPLSAAAHRQKKAQM